MTKSDIKKDHSEDIESWRDRLARITKEQMDMVVIESEETDDDEHSNNAE